MAISWSPWSTPAQTRQNLSSLRYDRTASRIASRAPAEKAAANWAQPLPPHAAPPPRRRNASALADMTEGQRLAIEQLRAIQENALGAFEVIGIAEQPNAAGWLRIDISLDCSGKARSE